MRIANRPPETGLPPVVTHDRDAFPNPQPPFDVRPDPLPQRRVEFEETLLLQHGLGDLAGRHLLGGCLENLERDPATLAERDRAPEALRFDRNDALAAPRRIKIG